MTDLGHAYRASKFAHFLVPFLFGYHLSDPAAAVFGALQVPAWLGVNEAVLQSVERTTTLFIWRFYLGLTIRHFLKKKYERSPKGNSALSTRGRRHAAAPRNISLLCRFSLFQFRETYNVISLNSGYS